VSTFHLEFKWSKTEGKEGNKLSSPAILATEVLVMAPVLINKARCFIKPLFTSYISRPCNVLPYNWATGVLCTETVTQLVGLKLDSDHSSPALINKMLQTRHLWALIPTIHNYIRLLRAHNEYYGWLEFKSWSQSTLLCKTRLIWRTEYADVLGYRKCL